MDNASDWSTLEPHIIHPCGFGFGMSFLLQIRWKYSEVGVLVFAPGRYVAHVTSEVETRPANHV
jgi:hypothetical protein